MISDALTFLKDQLTSDVRVRTGSSGAAVVFADKSKPGEIALRDDAITLLLTGIEEERLFRAGGAPGNGAAHEAGSGLQLNLFALFVSRFEDYSQSLRYLSMVLSFFHGKPTLNHQNSPDLNTDIEKLVLELQNLSLSQQKALWESLRMPYQPSVLYKVRLVVIRDPVSPEFAPVVTQTQTIVSETPANPKATGGGS